MVKETAAMVQSGLKDVVKEIQDFKTKLKFNIVVFKEEFKKEIHEELKKFK